MSIFAGILLERLIVRRSTVRAMPDPPPPVPIHHPCYGCERRGGTVCALPCCRGMSCQPPR